MTILVNKVSSDPDKAEVLGRGELQVRRGGRKDGWRLGKEKEGCDGFVVVRAKAEENGGGKRERKANKRGGGKRGFVLESRRSERERGGGWGEGERREGGGGCRCGSGGSKCRGSTQQHSGSKPPRYPGSQESHDIIYTVMFLHGASVLEWFKRSQNDRVGTCRRGPGF